MEKLRSVLKTNLIYGLLVLVPSAVIVLLLSRIVEALDKMAVILNVKSTASVVISILLAIMLLLFVCFIVGALVRTRLGSVSLKKFESTVLKQIPGYEIISNILKGFAEKRTAYSAATVRLFGPGTAVFGFVMEENQNGTVTVFVPSAPAMTVGSVHVVDSERVTKQIAHPLHCPIEVAEHGKSASTDVGEQHGRPPGAKDAPLDLGDLQVRVDRLVDTDQMAGRFKVVDALGKVSVAHRIE